MKEYQSPVHQPPATSIFFLVLWCSGVLMLTQGAFGSFIKGEVSCYNSTPCFRFSLNNPIAKEKRQAPEISLDLGVIQKKDDFGVLIGMELKRRFLQFEGQVSSSYIFMKNDDIVFLDLLITDPKTSKISILYGAFLETKRKESFLFIGPGISYEISPFLTGGLSLQFGHSLRYVLGVMYK